MSETAQNAQGRDWKLFGTMESMAQNRAKVREVQWGTEMPEGVVLASLEVVGWVWLFVAMAGHKS